MSWSRHHAGHWRRRTVRVAEITDKPLPWTCPLELYVKNSSRDRDIRRKTFLDRFIIHTGKLLSSE